MSRERFAKIADDTLAAIERGTYLPGDVFHQKRKGAPVPIKKLVDACVSRTLLYAPGEPKDLPNKVKINYAPKISVTNESTLEAAYRLRDKNACALNFASAKHPGGGFIRGSVAQEETIARASGLHESLTMCEEYYTKNKRANSFYLDYAIYSPNVPVFRNDACDWLDAPYTVSIVTSPAPKRTQIEQDIKEGKSSMSLSKMYLKLERVIDRRLNQVLSVMADNGHSTIILGAWGCGVFGNDQDMIVSAFKRGLKFAPWFDEVVFAIYDDPESKTFKVFNKEFG